MVDTVTTSVANSFPEPLKRELQAARKRLDKLERVAQQFYSDKVPTAPKRDQRAEIRRAARKVQDREDLDCDWLWGAASIAGFIGCTVDKVYYLFGVGAFEDALWKFGRKTLIGSKQKLRALAERRAAESLKSTRKVETRFSNRVAP